MPTPNDVKLHWSDHPTSSLVDSQCPLEPKWYGMPPLCFAYYCSGHGYGHATRVSAFACHLLSLPEPERPIIHIVSSAPEHVFADSIALGALYRYAEIDPVIVQPLAYRVDRQKSVDALKAFLDKKDVLLATEHRWLLDIHASCVLSDAAFLGCLAAKAAGILSVLITNFTFDSVYSYLSTSLVDAAASPDIDHLHPHNQHIPNFDSLVPDVPVPLKTLAPLVEQILTGYRCADILFLLPGHIPIPSFSLFPLLPSSQWIDEQSNHFHDEIVEHLTRMPASYTLHPPIPFPNDKTIPRTIIPAPLLVRPPNPNVYSAQGRFQLLASIGVPPELHDYNETKVLIVSFGGQVFRPPRSGSRSPSRSRDHSPERSHSPSVIPNIDYASRSRVSTPNDLGITNDSTLQLLDKDIPPECRTSNSRISRIATSSHLLIPGAPPTSKPLPIATPPQTNSALPVVSTIPPTPREDQSFEQDDSFTDSPRLLPDASWIAIVCGVSKEQWKAKEENDQELPDGFFVAPRDVYMPDLTAIGDVLLGKLGYGTVSECVDSCTPFVYVSRPLFIEEHGLRLLLDREGVGVELSRQLYEAGEWANAVEDAWVRGREAKMKKREDMALEIGVVERQEEGRDMARRVVGWTREWLGNDNT